MPIQPIYVFAEKLKSCHQLVNRDHVLVHAAALRTGGRIVVARLLLLAVAAVAAAAAAAASPSPPPPLSPSPLCLCVHFDKPH